MSHQLIVCFPNAFFLTHSLRQSVTTESHDDSWSVPHVIHVQVSPDYTPVRVDVHGRVVCSSPEDGLTEVRLCSRTSSWKSL